MGMVISKFQSVIFPFCTSICIFKAINLIFDVCLQLTGQKYFFLLKCFGTSTRIFAPR